MNIATMIFFAIIFICVALTILLTIFAIYESKLEKERREAYLKKLNRIVDNGFLLEADFIMDHMKPRTVTRQELMERFGFTGIYVLTNKSNGKSYVGQSGNVINRVYTHLRGGGAADVYADFKYGDKFEVLMIPLVNSGFDSLNDLERAMIEKFKGYEGYNLNKGNHR